MPQSSLPASSTPSPKTAWIAVLVAALGYFVDIYDLILFSVVRVPSLVDLGLTPEEVTSKGLLILNLQMVGMLIGGFLWGIMGDRKGRMSVLFASIITYSVAQLLNAAVTTVEQYAVVRFIAGIGLAGELGVGIALVSESLPTKHRGIGTTIVASIGVAGALAAFWVSEYVGWRQAYVIGGVMGLALLGLRWFAHESGLFGKLDSSVSRGSLRLLFGTAERLRRYLGCVGVGLPLWFVVGIPVTLAPEFAVALGITEPVKAGRAVMYCYGGLIVGDLTSGLLSQVLKSRRLAITVYILGTGAALAWYFTRTTANELYWACGVLGLAVGYWAVFVTVAAEQFGTNLRATVATTVPNMVRGSLPIFTGLFLVLKPSCGVLTSATLVGGVAIVLSLIATWSLRESFSRDLDWVEH